MPRPDQIGAGNRDYQQGLAASLVGTMGIDRAVETCLRNGWDGVLERVLRAAEERRVAARLRMNHYAEPLAIPGARGQRMMHRLRSWRDSARRMRRTLI